MQSFTEDVINQAALRVLNDNRVVIFIVAYNAEKHIERVLHRIPTWIAEKLSEIYIIDDHSVDNTFNVAGKITWPDEYAPLKIYRTPYNQGYGGNQRLGYLYAIEKNFDIVILLHGDGQYAPEALPNILAPYADGAEVVFGSRFINFGDAIKGGMPLYKWVGNRILTGLQNSILGLQMSEMHSGYRSYRTKALQQIPFAKNSLGFDFDADIIVQLYAAGIKITEVPIPTFYGEEICYVNGFRYAWQCIKTVLKYRIMQLELFYDPKFDIRKSEYIYTSKLAPTSLHYYIRKLSLPNASRILDVGGGAGDAVGKALAKHGMDVVSIDQYIEHIEPSELLITQHSVNLDEPWNVQFKCEAFDVALVLDVLEHLNSPDIGTVEVYNQLIRNGKLYASTGNVAFLPLRLALFFGWFNYGRRGILDMTHRRVFTMKSFSRLMRNAGFKIDKIIGFGPPIVDSIGLNNKFAVILDRIAFLLAKLCPQLFAYQILIECTRLDSPSDLMGQTFLHSLEMRVQQTSSFALNNVKSASQT